MSRLTFSHHSHGFVVSTSQSYTYTIHYSNEHLDRSEPPQHLVVHPSMPTITPLGKLSPSKLPTARTLPKSANNSHSRTCSARPIHSTSASQSLQTNSLQETVHPRRRIQKASQVEPRIGKTNRHFTSLAGQESHPGSTKSHERGIPEKSKCEGRS